MTDFQLRHGEAVAIGVALDTIYSSLALGLPQAAAEPSSAACRISASPWSPGP